MKKKYTILISLIALLFLVVSMLLLLAVRSANENLSSLQAQNRQLEDKVNKQSSDLKIFDGVEKSDLLKVCTDKAKAQYSEYIRANSISVTEGNVTTLSPKSPNIIRQADQERTASEKNCSDRFSD